MPLSIELKTPSRNSSANWGIIKQAAIQTHKARYQISSFKIIRKHFPFFDTQPTIHYGRSAGNDRNADCRKPKAKFYFNSEPQAI